MTTLRGEGSLGPELFVCLEVIAHADEADAPLPPPRVP